MSVTDRQIMARCNSNLSLRFRCGLHFPKNCLSYKARERANPAPIEAKLPQRRQTETLDPCLCRKNCILRRICPQPEIPRYLCVTGAGIHSKIIRREAQTSTAVGTPESSCNADDNLLVRNFRQDNETRALEPDGGRPAYDCVAAAFPLLTVINRRNSHASLKSDRRRHSYTTEVGALMGIS